MGPDTNKTESSPEQSNLSESGEATSPLTNDPLKSNNKTKTNKVVLSLFAILLLFASLTTVYVFFYLPNTPNNVLMTGLYNTYVDNQIKSGKLSGSVNFSGKSVPKYLEEIVFTGSFDEKGSVAYTASTSVAGNDLSGEMIKIEGDNTYVKLIGTKNTKAILKKVGTNKYINDNAGQTINILASLDGKWIITDDTFKQVTSSITGPFKTTQLSKEDTQKVVELYKKHPFLQIDEVMADEEIDGHSSKHFKVSVNEENQLAYLMGIEEAKIPDVFVSTSPEEYKKAKDNLKESFEIWVRKSDKVINKMISTNTTKASTTVWSVTRTNINEPVSISAPSGAKSFKDLVKATLKANN
jgi:hypothetical protein